MQVAPAGVNAPPKRLKARNRLAETKALHFLNV